MTSPTGIKAVTWVRALFSGGSSFWLPLLPYLIAIVGILLAFQQYTSKVRLEATAKNDAVWEKRLDEYDKAAQKRINDLYAKSSELADIASKNTTAQRQATQAALKTIVESASAGSYLEVKNGQCVLKPEFIRAFNTVHNTLPGAKK